MKKDLTIRFNVDLPYHHAIGASGFIFHKWLPSKKNQIIIDNDLFKIELYFDSDCTVTKTDDLDRQINVICNIIKCKYVAKKIDTILINHFRNNIKTINQENVNIRKLAENLAKDVFINVVSTINNIIKYARINKGQYWLEDLTLDYGNIEQFFNKWDAKASDTPDNSKSWFRWRPVYATTIYCKIASKKTYIEKEDWNKIKQTILEHNKFSFTRELISRARLLESFGYKRNALVDAIISLEISLNNFCTRPNIKLINRNIPDNKIVNFDYLKKSRSHLGFSATIIYLIPLFFPRTIIDENLIQTITEAIETRNNIIHNGQRKIEGKKVLKYINKVEELSDILVNYTN